MTWKRGGVGFGHSCCRLQSPCGVARGLHRAGEAAAVPFCCRGRVEQQPQLDPTTVRGGSSWWQSHSVLAPAPAAMPTASVRGPAADAPAGGDAEAAARAPGLAADTSSSASACSGRVSSSCTARTRALLCASCSDDPTTILKSKKKKTDYTLVTTAASASLWAIRSRRRVRAQRVLRLIIYFKLKPDMASGHPAAAQAAGSKSRRGVGTRAPPRTAWRRRAQPE